MTVADAVVVGGGISGIMSAYFLARVRPHVLLVERGVLAGEGFLSQLPQTRRRILPTFSLITLAETLSDAGWQAIGWEARECISAPRFAVDYLSKTADGGILFGGRGAPYHFGSGIRDEYDQHDPIVKSLQDNVRAWFPMLKDVRFTHSLREPLGWPGDYVPTIGYRARDGLATANLSGCILADLIAHTDSVTARLPIVNLRSRDWEPEPLRFLGVRYVQVAFRRLDAKAGTSGVPPGGKSLAERLTRH